MILISCLVSFLVFYHTDVRQVKPLNDQATGEIILGTTTLVIKKTRQVFHEHTECLIHAL